jgi:Fe-S oxidoreductase
MINAMAVLPCDVTWDTFVETDAGRNALSCIQCGMCAGTCPYGDAMDYPPRRLIAMWQAGLVDQVIRSQSLLLCVTCYACAAKCPRGIQLTQLLLPLVKALAFEAMPEVPAELQKALMNTLRYGNPMGESPRKRAQWADGAGVPVRVLPLDPKPVDVLWFVECYPSYHPRGIDNARATARVFHRLGVDFGILGPEEKCTGECARLAGEVGLFDALEEQNLKALSRCSFRRLVTTGAHAYDAFKHQYSCRGFARPVDHTVTFLAERLTEVKPLLHKKLNHVVTYHDSCTLGRHNGIFDQPRALLRAIPGVKLVEMVHYREGSLCCGGGGGGMWLDTYYKAKGLERLSERRVREAVAAGADVLAVSCPYEVSRFEDALKVLGYDQRMIVRDVTELLDESMGGMQSL